MADTYDLNARPQNQFLPPHGGVAYAGVSIQRPDERAAMLAAIPDGADVCEIGTFSATTARWIADQRPRCHVLAVDNFAVCGGQNVVYALQNYRRTAHKNLNVFIGTAAEFYRWHPSARFDVLLVDADHRYEAVVADLAVAERLTKPGGLILAHDNDQEHPGVMQAVAEFLTAHAWTVERQTSSLAAIRIRLRGTT